MAQVVSEMGFIWNPEHEDNAVDGTIQIVAHDGKVTALRILAQVKSTTSGLGWDGDRFRRSFTKDHIDFWLAGPLPVIVVIVDLRTKAAWWKDVRVWFANRGNYRRRSVIFEREADRFSTDTASRLADLATPPTQPVPRIRSEEQLISNLLEITGFAPIIYNAPTPAIDRTHAWELMRQADAGFEGGFSLDPGRVNSFCRLDIPPLDALVDGPVKTMPTQDWSESSDLDAQRRFVALLNATLRSVHHDTLAFDIERKVTYRKATEDKAAEKFRGRGLRERGRTWFTPVLDRDTGSRVTHYRHYAAHLFFQRWDGRWYLEINPTWHFTADGERTSLYNAEKVAALKRMEGQRAVYHLVKSWAERLHGASVASLFEPGDSRIVFGELATVKTDAAIDESVWKPPPDQPDEDQLQIEGLV